MADVGCGGKTAPFRHQETVSRDTEYSVVVKSPPVAAFIVTQPEFLFEFLVVALNHPAVLADPNQSFQREFPWQARQPVTARFPGSGWPLDQQPLFWL